MGKKILLLYISEDSGHHCATLAIERALKKIDPFLETLNINSFNYTNPILEKVINQTYMSVVKRTPELWDYLYDNPKVMKQVQKLRDVIHRFNKSKPLVGNQGVGDSQRQRKLLEGHDRFSVALHQKSDNAGNDREQKKRPFFEHEPQNT